MHDFRDMCYIVESLKWVYEDSLSYPLHYNARWKNVHNTRLKCLSQGDKVMTRKLRIWSWLLIESLLIESLTGSDPGGPSVKYCFKYLIVFWRNVGIPPQSVLCRNGGGEYSQLCLLSVILRGPWDVGHKQDLSPLTFLYYLFGSSIS